MDLNRVTEFYQPTSLATVPKWKEGFAWLAGGTWLFSEPQPSVCALIDLDTLSWPALQLLPQGLDEVVTFNLYFDDPHGSREHRRHLTYYYAEQIRAELEGA